MATLAPVIGRNLILEVELDDCGAGLGSLLQHPEIRGWDCKFETVKSIVIRHITTFCKQYMDFRRVLVSNS